MDAEAANMFFEQIHGTLIEPELARRSSSRQLPQGFKIYRARVLLPKGAPPVVAFNDDIEWLYRMELGETGTAKVGDVVHWDQVRRITSVAAPEIDGVRVAFVYLFKVTKGYQFIFDFSPNLTPDEAVGLPPTDWGETFGPAIARTIQDGHVERSFHLDDLVRIQLTALGFWPAPALVPFPFREIVRHVAEGDPEAARRALIMHCTPAFVTSVTESWWATPEFAVRRTLLSDAVRAHGEGRYVLSIPALLPQLEGLITDWMVRIVPQAQVPFKQKPKTVKFRDLVLGTEGKSFVFRKVVDASLSIHPLEGPVCRAFNTEMTR